MLYIFTLLFMIFGFQNSHAQQTEQPARKRATTELKIKVYTPQERERSRSRASSAAATPSGHRKQFTELYEHLQLTAPERKEEEKASYLPAYVENLPQVRRSPRGTMITSRKQEIKFKKQQPKSCCVIQ